MNKKLFILASVLLVLALLFASCTTEKKVESISIVEDTVKTEYYVGDTPDFKDIKVVVTYVDGTAVTVGAEDLVIGGLDTSTAGEKTLSIKYRNKEATLTVTVKEKEPPAPTLTGIAIVPGSAPTSVFVGDVHNISALQVEATYSDGTKKAVSAAELEITEVDTATAGKKSLTVKYGDKTATLEVTVVGVSEIQVYTSTLANKVFVGQTLNTSLVEALVTYTDGTSETVTADKLTFAPLDTATMGDKTLLITYRGFTLEYAVKVVGVVDIEVNNVPASVRVNSQLDTSGITVNALYSDLTKLPVDMSKVVITNISTATAGEASLKVSYAGIEKSVPVSVIGVKDITVVGSTLKNEVILDGIFRTENTVVTVTYTDNTTETVDARSLTFSSVDTSVAGVVNLEITYLDKTVEFPVTVCGFIGMSVEGVPLSVKAGEELDLSQMKVYLLYSDSLGSRLIVTEGISTNASSLDFDVEGDKVLTVTYSGEHGTFSKDVTISTTEPDYIGIRVDTHTALVGYKQTYSTLDTIKAFALYGNGTEKPIDASALNLSNIDTSVAGVKTLTVSYVEGGVTHSTDVNVEVLPITKLTVSGVPALIEKGDSIDRNAIAAVVTFGEGNKKLELIVNESGGLVIGAPAGVGETTLPVSYEGFEVSIPLHVRATVSMIILTGSLPEYVRPGYENEDVAKGDITVEITYTDKTKRSFKLSELSGYEATVSASGEVFVSYVGSGGYMSATAQVEVLTILSINALNGTVPTTVLKDGVLDYSKMQLTVIYKRASGETIAYAINNTDPRLTISEIDTSTTGEKAVVFTFTGFGETASIIVTVKGVKDISLVPGSINTTVNVDSDPGATLDTTTIQVRVEFTDGTYIYADTTDINLIVGSVDISTEGTKVLVVSYLGKETAIEIEVKSYTTSGKIYGSTLPDTLSSRDAYKKNFKDQNSIYVVGDDNPYYFYLSLLMLDQNYEIIDVNGKTALYNVNLYLIDGGETLLSPEEMATYVYIDEATNGYDFTEAAIGKIFRIEIWPKDEASCAVDPLSLKRSHTVRVVDAYNIYDEKEFNILTNIEEDVNSNKVEGYVSSMAVVNQFLADNGIERPSRLAGIVIHRNMNIQLDDIPSEYLYEYKVNGKTEKGFYDQMGVYHRAPTPEDPVFTMWGNYYSVFTYNLPCIVPSGVANNDDQYSSSDIFKFDGFASVKFAVEAGTLTNGLDYDESKFVVNVNDMAFRDNDPNSNDQSASERHMRGLICMKFRALTANVTNTNIDAYYLSTVVDCDDVVLNLNKVKFYNAWQGHIFVWNKNHIQGAYGDKNSDPYAGYDPVRVNITDSLVAKCGGPVILCQADEKSYACSKLSGTYVTADAKSEMYSYVTGQEAWFVAVGQTAMAADIKALNGLITGFSQQYVQNFAQAGVQLKPASFSSKDKIEGVETMNMLMVVMGTQVGQNEGYIGQFVKDGKTILDTTNAKLKEYQSAPETGYGQMPIFQSSAGGTCYYNAMTQNQAEMLQSLASDPHTSPYGAYLGATQPDVPCFEGDYISLSVGGIGICLDYYH